MDPPRDHPLWSAFEAWAKENLGPESMRAVYWAAFTAGAAARDGADAARLREVHELVREQGRVLGVALNLLKQLTGGEVAR
jgi:hypothetical protein